jgi:hypothetical protein
MVREDDHTFIDNAFGFHPANDVTRPTHQEFRKAVRAFAHSVVDSLPNSREKSLFLTNLQQAAMWANAAIAINGSPFTEEE